MTDNLTIRWGFIGCGEVTEKKSGPAFSAVDGSKVVAVMSRNKEKARSYAIRHGIPNGMTMPNAWWTTPTSTPFTSQRLLRHTPPTPSWP